MAVILGDVAAAHDASSLALARLVRTPLAIVVLDNGGGRIFERLPVARAASAAELALFTTPPDIDFEALARAYGVAYARADANVGVHDAVDAALARSSATLVHVVCQRAKGALTGPLPDSRKNDRSVCSACGSSIEVRADRTRTRPRGRARVTCTCTSTRTRTSTKTSPARGAAVTLAGRPR
jgi:hypothetical protein